MIQVTLDCDCQKKIGVAPTPSLKFSHLRKSARQDHLSVSFTCDIAPKCGCLIQIRQLSSNAVSTSNNSASTFHDASLLHVLSVHQMESAVSSALLQGSFGHIPVGRPSPCFWLVVEITFSVHFQVSTLASWFTKLRHAHFLNVLFFLIASYCDPQQQLRYSIWNLRIRSLLFPQISRMCRLSLKRFRCCQLQAEDWVENVNDDRYSSLGGAIGCFIACFVVQMWNWQGKSCHSPHVDSHIFFYFSSSFRYFVYISIDL